MNNQHVEQQPAYVLHSRPFRETSLIVDIFSFEYGRISLLARGKRRSKDPQQAIIQPFYPLQISWRGRHELKNLQHVEAAGQALRLQSKRLYSGFYVNELLMRLLPKEDPQTHLFAYYQALLEALQQQDDATEILLRRFERQLLSQLGYDIVTTHEYGNDAAIATVNSYDYFPLQGFMLASDETVSGRLRVPGQVLLALAADDYQSATDS